MMDTIASIRERLDDIRDDRHFPAHMLSAHDAMTELLDEMEAAILALQSPPAKVNRECPSSPDGRHQVDTSMESGPNNCFHCEAPMNRTVDAAPGD